MDTLDAERKMRRLSVWFVAMCFAVALPAQGGAQPFIEAPDGMRIPLQDKALAVDAALVEQPRTRILRPMAPLPQRVDLTASQTPVKSQGGRDTCGTFASVAALEAAYQRNFNVTLDLSEQYVNHWTQQFASAGSGRALPGNETIAGSIGGGGLARPLAAMMRGLAVPPESALPYIGDPGYQNVDAGDQPSVNDWSLTYPQRAIDDFNLADMQATYVYSPPTSVMTTVMPQTALDAARYRPIGVTFLTANEVNDVETYRTILAAQHEIVMEFRCCDGNPGFNTSTPWQLPTGSNGGGFGHVMVVVGYDDAMQMFRVKNSWGNQWAEGGLAWVSYDLVRRAAVGAAYMQGVMSPHAPLDPWNYNHFFLGRWQLNFDGWKAVLDVYNLPEAWSPGPHNYRVGTLFMADGRIRRVNGTISGNALTFWVDEAAPDMSPSQLTGSPFTVRIFSWDHRAMAGTLGSGNSPIFAVEAVKNPSPVTGVARPGGLGVASYLGTWDFNHDGWHGRIEILSANKATRQIAGRYVDANGHAFALNGRVNPDARLFNFDIAFPTPQSFDGFLNGHERGVMAGTTVWGGMTFGFFGTRRP